MIIIEGLKTDGALRYQVRRFEGLLPIGVNPGVYDSIEEVLAQGFGNMLKPNIQAELKDHLEIKGFYKFDPADAFEEHFD